MSSLRGMALFTLAFLGAACAEDWNRINDPATEPLPVQVPSIDSLVVAAVVPADGATLVTVRATVANGTLRPPSPVLFTTTSGIFMASGTNSVTVLPDDARTTNATLRPARDTGTVIVRAAVAGSSKSQPIRMTWAYPQQLLLSAPALSLSLTAKGQLTITAMALRVPGLVSRGTPVMFSLERFDAFDKAAPGSLDGPAATDTLGNASIHYTAGNSTAPDSVWLRVSAPRSGTPGDTVSSRIKLYVIP